MPRGLPKRRPPRGAPDRPPPARDGAERPQSDRPATPHVGPRAARGRHRLGPALGPGRCCAMLRGGARSRTRLAAGAGPGIRRAFVGGRRCDGGASEPATARPDFGAVSIHRDRPGTAGAAAASFPERRHRPTGRDRSRDGRRGRRHATRPSAPGPHGRAAGAPGGRRRRPPDAGETRWPRSTACPRPGARIGPGHPPRSVRRMMGVRMPASPAAPRRSAGRLVPRRSRSAAGRGRLRAIVTAVLGARARRAPPRACRPGGDGPPRRA